MSFKCCKRLRTRENVSVSAVHYIPIVPFLMIHKLKTHLLLSFRVKLKLLMDVVEYSVNSGLFETSPFTGAHLMFRKIEENITGV